MAPRRGTPFLFTLLLFIIFNFFPYFQQGHDVEAALKLQSIVHIQRQLQGADSEHVQDLCTEFIFEANAISTNLVSQGLTFFSFFEKTTTSKKGNYEMAISLLQSALRETDAEVGMIKSASKASKLRSTTLNNLGCALHSYALSHWDIQISRPDTYFYFCPPRPKF